MPTDTDWIPDPPKDDERERFSPATRERISRRTIEYLRAERDEALTERDAAYARGRADAARDGVACLDRATTRLRYDHSALVKDVLREARAGLVALATAPAGYLCVRVEALATSIAKGHHDTCSTALVEGLACDCGHDELRAALAGQREGGP